MYTLVKSGCVGAVSGQSETNPFVAFTPVVSTIIERNFTVVAGEFGSALA